MLHLATRPLTALHRTLNAHHRRRYSSTSADFEVDHLVIGGGVVGLAVAERLTREHPAQTTLLVERNKRIGEETSSRNSEVIHAGIYYPPSSLKTSLCIRGNRLLYQFCAQADIPHRAVGKWIVAQTPKQYDYLLTLKQKADLLGVPVRFLSRREMHAEPAVRASEALLSPTTGIVDSHALMACLAANIAAAGGDVALRSGVEHIEPCEGSRYLVTVRTTGTAPTMTVVCARAVINAAGLHADRVASLVLPGVYRQHYAKGRYYGYRASEPAVRHLIYPCPEENLAGLGTHLTLDLSGRIKFGPDVEYVERTDDYDVEEGKVDEFYRAIAEYLPGVRREALYADYAGIRPKLSGPGEPFRDFVIREERDRDLPGFINLVGIESPGLTSSLAIAEMVDKILYG